MDPQARSRLAAAARRYLAAEPWRFVGDSYLFGLHDRTAGRFGCAAVMGQSGIEFGLDVSFDEQGFSLLQKVQDEEFDYSTYKAKASSVSFSITDAAPASREFQRLERFVVDKQKVKAPRRGYLTGFRLADGRDLRPLDSDEAVFLARGLEAVAELAETGRLGRDVLRDGNRTLFFNLTENAGKLSIRSSYRRVEEIDVLHPKIALPAELAARLKTVPRIEGRYLLSMFSPPATVQGELVWMALMLDARGRAVLAHAEQTFSAAALSVFEAFGGKTTMDGAGVGVPREVWVDSFPAFEALKDAMLDLEIRFVSKNAIRELELARESLSDHLAGA